MITYLDDLPAGIDKYYDLCIIGSGPAASACIDTLTGQAGCPLKVVVLEGGDPRVATPPSTLINQEFSCAAQTLNKGSIEGWIAANKPNYLTSSRIRHPGGGGRVWSGWAWPMEALDFAPRSFRPGAAWPFSGADLDPYCRAAHRMLTSGPYFYDDADSWGSLVPGENFEPLPGLGSVFKPRGLQICRGRLATAVERVAASTPSVDLLLNANVIGLERSLGASSRRCISGVRVASLKDGRPGSEYFVRADRFVIAAGALEATRLMLMSSVGNSNGWLGRGFTEHFYLWNAAVFESPEALQSVFARYDPLCPKQTAAGVGAVHALVASESWLDSAEVGAFRVLFGGVRPGLSVGTVNLSWEQEVSFESSVGLDTSGDLDALGCPRISLRTPVSANDRKSARVVIDQICAFLRGLGCRRIVTGDLQEDIFTWREPERVVPGNHPMGTTRMHLDPALGVVDADCRVHDAENLYVLSTSVFPSGGYANPMMSLMALGIRLGEYLLKDGEHRA